jgi:hypothetical protein
MPGRNTAEETKIIDRRQRVAALYLRGRTQTSIAEELGCDQATVSRDLASLRGEWKESALRDFDEAKALELARVDALESEAWSAWEAGKKPAAGGKGKDQGGAEYLRVVAWCIARRCAIFGLDAPKRNELTGPGGKPLQSETKLTTHDLATDLAPYRDALAQLARSGVAGGGNGAVPQDGPV